MGEDIYRIYFSTFPRELRRPKLLPQCRLETEGGATAIKKEKGKVVPVIN
jgi:hypothetical protein